MTTRSEARAALRLRLEDGGGGPLWEDALLDEAIGDAVRRYGQVAPKEATASVAVAAGARRIALPAGTVDLARVVRVRDPGGTALPRWRDDDLPGDPAQAWRAWNDGIDLARPAVAGAWSIDHRTGRAAPTSDASPLDVLPGDEPAVLALALAAALDRRAAEEAKRGMAKAAAGVAALAASARADGERLLRRRRRERLA